MLQNEDLPSHEDSQRRVFVETAVFHKKLRSAQPILRSLDVSGAFPVKSSG